MWTFTETGSKCQARFIPADQHCPIPMLVMIYVLANGKKAAVTLMNFRRYGWCLAPHAPENDEQRVNLGGFGHGVVWANGLDGMVSCETPEQVIRETFVATLADVAQKLPGVFVYSAQMRPLYNKLVEEALENPKSLEWAERACHGTNGSCEDVEVLS